MTSIFEGQSPKSSPKLQPKQGAPFGWCWYGTSESPNKTRGTRMKEANQRTHAEKRLCFLSQWLTGFKLLGIPYLVGKIIFKLFFQGPLAI